jgi:hypothetical protein
MVHDGRAFATFGCEGNGWGQGGGLPWTCEAINMLIRVCGAKDLIDCQGKLIRITREDQMIKSLVHIVDDSIRLDVR